MLFASQLLARRFICRSHIYPSLLHPAKTFGTSVTCHDKLGTVPYKQSGGMLPSVHWTIERVVSIGMIPLYPVALFMDTPVMNFIVVSAVSLHAYWGLNVVIKDYAFERRYGPLLMPILKTIWKIFVGIGYSGLLYFNYNDIGFISAVKSLWSI